MNDLIITLSYLASGAALTDVLGMLTAALSIAVTLVILFATHGAKGLLK